jgi:hypothetical protein
LTIDVTGWFSANARTAAGMVAVGTNAELRNGRNTSEYENALEPSTDFAVRPGMTASHVSASASAFGRKPIMSAAMMIRATEIALDTSEARTCDHILHDPRLYKMLFQKHPP